MDEQNKSVNERWAPPTNPRERGYATDPGFSSSPEYASSPNTQATSDDVPRRTAEIREEIDATRADMSETIDAIQERLRPANVASRAAESVRDATVGRVKEFAGQVTGRNRSRDREWDDDWRYRSSGWDGSRGNTIIDRVRDNPVAAALAAGSLAWIFFGSRRQSGYRYSQDDQQRAIYGSTRGREAFVRETRIDVDESPESRGWSDHGDPSGWRNTASQAGQRMMSEASQVGRRSRNFAADSPFAAGAIAAAIGLAIGLTIPETERENEILGEARDSMVERGKETVRTAAERVQTAATQVQRVAGDALKGIASGESPQSGGSQAANEAQSATQRPTPSPAATTVGESGTEQPVPGSQAGSGGTGATPTAKTGSTRTKTR